MPLAKLRKVPTGTGRGTVLMFTGDTNDPQHWRERAAKMRALAVKMAGSHAAILINDLAVDYDELADRAALKEAALKGKSLPNGKRR